MTRMPTTTTPDFLDQARLRPPQPKDQAAIINTLLKAKNEGKAKTTLRNISEMLSQLSRKTNLQNPEQVKSYISDARANEDMKYHVKPPTDFRRQVRIQSGKN